MQFKWATFGLAAMLLTPPAQTVPLPRYGLIVYSSLCRDRMTDV